MYFGFYSTGEGNMSNTYQQTYRIIIDDPIGWDNLIISDDRLLNLTTRCLVTLYRSHRC